MNKEEESYRTSIYLEPEYATKIRILAELENTTINKQFEKAINYFLENHEKKDELEKVENLLEKISEE